MLGLWVGHLGRLHHLPLKKKQGLDALIDVIAPIVLEAPLTGKAVLLALPNIRCIGNKPFAVEAMNQNTRHWEFPVVGQYYSQVQSGVQMANRSGALTDIEFAEFLQKSQVLAAAVKGTCTSPKHSEVQRARELDQFANDHDAQLRFVVRSHNTAWSLGGVQQAAAQHGFVPGSTPGRMVMPASVSNSHPLLNLSFDFQATMVEETTQSVLSKVVLTLDVTHVSRSECAYDKMCKVAQMMAEELGGTLTDDNGVVLTEAAMETIADELAHLYDALDRCEFSAGSPLACRLFS